jgi:hypothetical protein
MASMKKHQSLKRNAGKILIAFVVACVMVTACGDKDKKQPVSVSISVDAPFKLQPGSLEYQTPAGNAWFKHTLTVENTSNRPIAISGDVPAQFIGEEELLVLNDQCGPNPPGPGGRLPTLACFAVGQFPLTVEPHASADIRNVYVYKGLYGMSTLTPGKYTADAPITWKFVDESEFRTDRAKVTYSVK